MSDGDTSRVLASGPSGRQRPSRDETFMAMAQALAERSTCKRAHVGALVTDAEGLQVLGIGYNGVPRGYANDDCSGVAGQCGCVHAELNALLKAPGTLQGKTLYTTTAPCVHCAQAILNGGVARVVYASAYRLKDGIWLLHGLVELSEM